MMYAIFQNTVIVLVVAYSAVYLWRKLLPKKASSPSAGCDSGCSTCNMCATGLAEDKAVPIRLIQ